MHKKHRVSQDGFVSYNGVRYGVPWHYSGREATVCEQNGHVEIWIVPKLIVRLLHKPEPHWGSCEDNGWTSG
ncbi:Mu transposase domain-containing protein [Thermoactinomyces mirandus]|uniref:Mu transposase domain-containing protein n=1 Tax=Thermoactinomyces mirandus TaxID=2756294 RepID=UPI0015EFAE78|nr:hypothetical protein [Thermoactinomyces mirandus]